jgi:hypothetical protein
VRAARLALALFATLAAADARAGLIQHSLVAGSGDGRVSFDPSTGLEWLDLTETLGHSVPGILAGAGFDPTAGVGWVPSGWRYATRHELCGLFEPLSGPVAGCSGSGVQSPEGIAELQALLGITDAQPGPGAGFLYSRGYYGAGEGLATLLRFDGAAIAELGAGDGAGDPGTGHYLVRPASVPEPSGPFALCTAVCAMVSLRLGGSRSLPRKLVGAGEPGSNERAASRRRA